MTILAGILLALAAGLTEILPVSGTGHLYILSKLLGVSVSQADFRSFHAMLLFGVAFAGILFYRTQLIDITRQTLVLFGVARPRSRERGVPFSRRLGLLLLLASLPMLPALALSGLFLRLEQGDFTLLVVSALFVLSGTVLYLTLRGARGRRTIHQMTLSDAAAAGVVQMLSVLPGLSRVGLTLCVLLGRGLDGPAAAEFTGLMSIPVFFGAGVVRLVSAYKSGEALAAAPYLILAFSLSALIGFFALRFFTNLMSGRRPLGFAYWVWAAAILALILFLISA